MSGKRIAAQAVYKRQMLKLSDDHPIIIRVPNPLAGKPCADRKLMESEQPDAAEVALNHIEMLFGTLGLRTNRGEPVTQLEHALQSALLAREAGATDALVIAALLHDLGHLINDQGKTPTERGIDDLHQYHGARVLHDLFGPEVREPIRLHVQAKRYLCAVRRGYKELLSPDAWRSLQLQGGPLTGSALDAFRIAPYAEDAVRLREWDDAAKISGKLTPSLASYRPLLARCALSPIATRPNPSDQE